MFTHEIAFFTAYCILRLDIMFLFIKHDNSQGNLRKLTSKFNGIKKVTLKYIFILFSNRSVGEMKV